MTDLMLSLKNGWQTGKGVGSGSCWNIGGGGWKGWCWLGRGVIFLFLFFFSINLFMCFMSKVRCINIKKEHSLKMGVKLNIW